MTTVIKSGTKQLHAWAWEFGRNDALDARNYFNPAPGKVAELRFQRYGFNVGGQVPFWKSAPDILLLQHGMAQTDSGRHHQPDRPSHQHLRWNFAATVITVPTAVSGSPAHPGRQLSAGGAAPGTVTARVSRSPTTRFPAAARSATRKSLLGAGIFPAPNQWPQFIGGNNLPTNVREEIVRIDHQFSRQILGLRSLRC